MKGWVHQKIQMQSLVRRFVVHRTIFGASQQNNIAEFSETAEVDGDLF